MQDTGCRILNAGYRMLDAEYWIRMLILIEAIKNKFFIY
jgi:hypothetical protein